MTQKFTICVFAQFPITLSLCLHVSFSKYVLGLGEMFCRRLLQFPSKHLTWHLLEHLFIPSLHVVIRILHATCFSKPLEVLKCTSLVYAEYTFWPILVIFRCLYNCWWNLCASVRKFNFWGVPSSMPMCLMVMGSSSCCVVCSCYELFREVETCSVHTSVMYKRF
jgi:hypothetical protein